MSKYTTIFLDLGGVILTNGWDSSMRKKAAETFNIEHEEFEELHDQFYNLHEVGSLTLEDYLNKVIFWKKRDFTFNQFKDFIFSQSQPYPEMINLIFQLKKKYHLKIVATSNEGRDLAEYRINTFNLKTFIDFFIISCFIHIRKPDLKFFQTSLDLTQVSPQSIIYIDDRKSGIAAATRLGIEGIEHKTFKNTEKRLLELLSMD